MSIKTKIIILSIIATTFTLLFLYRGLQIQIGSNQYHAEQLVIFSGHIEPVTGELLMSWSDETVPKRQATIEQSRSVDFRLYDFTYQPLITSFQKLARVGVKIRGIVEDQLFGNNSKSFRHLQKVFTGVYSIGLHSDQLLHDNFMHAKTFITDSGFIIQTANLSYSSFFNNREFFFISYDNGIHENLEKLFQKDRAGQTIKPEDIRPELLICPIDCRSKIETILSGAKKSIWMYEQYITDTHILHMLLSKYGVSNSEFKIQNSKGNIDVKLIIGDNGEKETLLKTPLKGVTHVRKKPYVHAKVILVDDTYLIVSSINLSANSMDENREIGIILIDSNLIAQFKSQFERDWKK